MRESAAKWDELHANPRFRPAYPSEPVVRFLLSVRASLPADLPPRFLDIGTGAGRHLALASELGFFPVGTDVSQNGLHHARERLTAKNASHAVLCTGMTELPFADNTFPVVLSYGVFYYGTADETRKAISESRRVMCTGGKILVVLRSTRDYRFGKGEELEFNTYRLKISDTNEFGATLHFVTAADIPEYFREFTQVSFESAEFTFGNRSRLNSDWIITAEK